MVRWPNENHELTFIRTMQHPRSPTDDDASYRTNSQQYQLVRSNLLLSNQYITQIAPRSEHSFEQYPQGASWWYGNVNNDESLASVFTKDTTRTYPGIDCSDSMLYAINSQAMEQTRQCYNLMPVPVLGSQETYLQDNYPDEDISAGHIERSPGSQLQDQGDVLNTVTNDIATMVPVKKHFCTKPGCPRTFKYPDAWKKHEARVSGDHRALEKQCGYPLSNGWPCIKPAQQQRKDAWRNHLKENHGLDEEAAMRYTKKDSKRSYTSKMYARHHCVFRHCGHSFEAFEDFATHHVGHVNAGLTKYDMDIGKWKLGWHPKFQERYYRTQELSRGGLTRNRKTTGN